MPHPFIVAVDGGITGVERLSGLPIGEDGTLIRYSFDGKGVEQRFGEVFQEIDLYTIPQAEKILRERGWASPEEIAARLSDGLAGAAAVEKTRKTI